MARTLYRLERAVLALAFDNNVFKVRVGLLGDAIDCVPNGCRRVVNRCDNGELQGAPVGYVLAIRLATLTKPGVIARTVLYRAMLVQLRSASNSQSSARFRDIGLQAIGGVNQASRSSRPNFNNSHQLPYMNPLGEGLKKVLSGADRKWVARVRASARFLEIQTRLTFA